MSRAMVVGNWLSGAFNVWVIIYHPDRYSWVNGLCAIASFTLCAGICYGRAVALYSEGKP